MVLTEDVRKQVEETGFAIIEDEQTGQSYALTKPKGTLKLEIPEGIQQSEAAFFKALPDLLQNKKLVGKWVAYQGDKQVKVAKTSMEVIRECNRLGLSPDEYTVRLIENCSAEVEEVGYPSSWTL